jgi:hypothetical protein
MSLLSRGLRSLPKVDFTCGFRRLAYLTVMKHHWASDESKAFVQKHIGAFAGRITLIEEQRQQALRQAQGAEERAQPA